MEFLQGVVIAAIDNLHIVGGVVPTALHREVDSGKKLTDRTLIPIAQRGINLMVDRYQVGCFVPRAIITAITVESIVLHTTHRLYVGTTEMNFGTGIRIPISREHGMQIEHRLLLTHVTLESKRGR